MIFAVFDHDSAFLLKQETVFNEKTNFENIFKFCMNAYREQREIRDFALKILKKSNLQHGIFLTKLLCKFMTKRMKKLLFQLCYALIFLSHVVLAICDLCTKSKDKNGTIDFF